MAELARAFKANEMGVTAIEYSLIAGIICVAIIGAVSLLGTSLTGTFNSLASNF